MTTNIKRYAIIAGTSIGTMALLAGPALATDPTTAAEAVGPGADALKLALLGVAGVAVVPGVTILAVRKGWRLAKGFF